MATKNTPEQAQELKAQLEQDLPGITIQVIDASGKRRVGRGVAERDSLEIVEDDGGIFVTVKVTQFSVLEVRNCGNCGNEYTTRAIGEYGLKECRSCREARLERHNQELDASIEQERQRVAKADWMNAWEES